MLVFLLKDSLKENSNERDQAWDWQNRFEEMYTVFAGGVREHNLRLWLC